MPHFDPYVPYRIEPPDRWHLRKLRAAGHVTELLPDVYVDSMLGTSYTLRVLALKHYLRPSLVQAEACAMGSTAAWIWSGRWAGASGADELPVLDFAIEPARRRKAAADERLRAMSLPDGHWDLMAGLPCATPARIVADLARELEPVAARQAIRMFTQRVPTYRQHVLDLLEQMPRSRNRLHAAELMRSFDLGLIGSLP